MVETKYWCFTLNNYDEQELSAIEGLTSETDVIGGRRLTYFIAGYEVGESGTPHLQGYLELTKPCRLAGVKRIPGLQRAHFERRRGTGAEAAAYCRKEETPAQPPIEFGELAVPKQGKRTDIDRIAERIRSGEVRSLGQLWREHPTTMVRYHVGMAKLFAELHVPPERPAPYDLRSDQFLRAGLTGLESTIRTGTHVIYGPSGCGKTSFCLAVFPKALVVSHMDQLRDFSSEKHEAIIFDDMSFTHMPRTAQIHLTDQDLERAIHIRYGVAVIPPNTVKVFTSNIRDIFEDDPAINRRVQYHQVGLLTL